MLGRVRASRQRAGIAFKAGLGAWESLPWACLAYTPKWPKKKGGIPPFDPFPSIDRPGTVIIHNSTTYSSLYEVHDRPYTTAG